MMMMFEAMFCLLPGSYEVCVKPVQKQWLLLAAILKNNHEILLQFQTHLQYYHFTTDETCQFYV